MNTRTQLCGTSSSNGLGSANWLSLGRAASNGLLSLDASHGIGHDVGFISFPFVEELAVYFFVVIFIVAYTQSPH